MLVMLGEDTEQCVRWPRELEGSFPGPVSHSNAFSIVRRVYT